MKKSTTKILSLLLILILVFTSVNITVIAENSTEYNYYVKYGGMGDGRSPSSPASTVAKAVVSINTDGHTAEDTVNIFIMQDSITRATINSSGYHNLTSWRDFAAGENMQNHTAHLIIQPYVYKDSRTVFLAESTKYGDIHPTFTLRGPVTFKKLNLVTVRDFYNHSVFLDGYNFTFEHIDPYSTYSYLASDGSINQAWAPTFSLSGGTTTHSKPFNVNILGSYMFGNFYLGDQNTYHSDITYNEDVNIIFDHPQIGFHDSLTLTVVAGPQNLTFKKNLNFKIKSVDDISFAETAGKTIKVNGGVQCIISPNNDIINPINNISTFASGTKLWTLNTENTKIIDYITYTDIAGTYNIKNGVSLCATNTNNDTVYSSNGKLILPEGTWNIAEAPIINYADTDLDGSINVKDLVILKKTISLDKNYYPSADINSDNAVNSQDLTLLKKHLLGVKLISWKNYKLELLRNNNLSGASDEEANALRDRIINAKDTFTNRNTIYYVAANGDDRNSGTSIDKPVTIDKVNSLPVKIGDAVLFKRGDVFRLKAPIEPFSGVAYGAYGEGPKPELLGSVRDYADPTIWESQNGSLWQTKIDEGLDVGNIILNNGEYCGDKKPSLKNIMKDGDYYFDADSSILYFKLTQLNPGYYFDSIEMANVQFIFRRSGYGPNWDQLFHDMHFENLSIKYPATHGFSLNFNRDCSVQYCEIGWIGGVWFGNNNDQNRQGNGVEFFDVAHNCNISNNYFYQIFDSAFTFQGSKYNDYTNLTYENNLIEYCSMNFEFWCNDPDDATPTSTDPDATFENISVSNNIFRFGGYGWSGIQRVSKADQAFILLWHCYYDAEQFNNFKLANNIFDTANCPFYFGTSALINLEIENNSYYQQAGSEHKTIYGYNLYAYDQESFETAIKIVDPNPKHIEWID